MRMNIKQDKADNCSINSLNFEGQNGGTSINDVDIFSVGFSALVVTLEIFDYAWRRVFVL